MSYSAKAVANYFLDLAKKHKKEVTPMKIQKLVYFAHGWFLAIEDKPLIDEPIETWKWGPVINSLYNEFKRYGRNSIPKHAVDFVITDKWEFVKPYIPEEDTFTIALLNRVWDIYSAYDAFQLSNITHQNDTPWDKTWKESKNKRDINNSLIRQYFLDKVTANKAKGN